jgi:hypothetical protein
MVEGDLAIPLFLAGTGVTIIVAGISQAGWRHRLLILGLFVVGAVLVLTGVCWHLIGNLLPTVTTVVSGIATSPVAWFVIVMFALAMMLIRNRQNHAAIPIMRPIMPVAAPEQQSPPIESGDLSDLIERCWNEHVPGSVLARETHAYNVAHAMKEDLKLRLREFLEEIRIIVGTGTPFDKFKESIYTRNHLIQIAVTARRTSTNCRVILEHITGSLSSHCPVIIRANFTINAGDTEYVPIAEFAERLNTSRPAPSDPGLIQVHFPINPLSDGKSYMDVGAYELSVLATSAETAATRIRCRLAVDDGLLTLRPI